MGFDQSIQAQQAAQQAQSASPYGAMSSPTYGVQNVNAAKNADLPIGMSSMPQNNVAMAAQAANIPQAAAQKPPEPPKPKKRGLFGTIGKMITNAPRMIKGATIGLATSIKDTVVNMVKKPFSLNSLIAWGTIIAGGICMVLPIPGLAQAAGAALIATGVGMAGFGAAKSGITAYKAYDNYQDEAGNAAMEDVGTNMGAMALNVVGAKVTVKGMPKQFTKPRGKIGMAGSKALVKAKVRKAPATPSTQKVIALKQRNTRVGQALSDTAYVTRYGFHSSGQLFHGWLKGGSKWKTLSEAKSAAAAEGGGFKGWWTAGRKVNGAYMAEQVAIAEQQKMQGIRTPGTNLGNEGIPSSISNDALISGLKAGFKDGPASRTFVSGDGVSRLYSKSAIEMELRARGLVQIDNVTPSLAQKMGTSALSQRVAHPLNSSNRVAPASKVSAQEWVQAAKARERLNAQRSKYGTPQLETRLADAQKQLKSTEEALATAQKNNASKSEISSLEKTVKKQEEAVTKLGAQLKKAEGKYSPLAKSVEREVIRPEKEGAAIYAQRYGQAGDKQAKVAQLEDDIAALETKRNGATKHGELVKQRTQAQKDLEKAQKDAKNKPNNKEKQDAVKAAQNEVQRLAELQSKKEVGVELMAKIRERDALKADAKALTQPAQSANDRIKQQGEKLVALRNEARPLEASKAYQNWWESSIPEAFGKASKKDVRKPVSDNIKQTYADIGYKDKPQVATLLGKQSKLTEFYSTLKSFADDGKTLDQLSVTERQALTKLHQEAGLGDTLPTNILKSRQVRNVETLVSHVEDGTSRTISTLPEKQMNQFNQHVNTVERLEKAHGTRPTYDGTIFSTQQAERLAKLQEKYNGQTQQGRIATTLGNTKLAKGIAFGSGAGAFGGSALNNYVKNMNDMMMANPYGDPFQMQNIAAGDAYIRESDSLFGQTNNGSGSNMQMPGQGSFA